MPNPFKMFDAFIHFTRKLLGGQSTLDLREQANVALLYQGMRATDTNDGGTPMFLCAVFGPPSKWSKRTLCVSPIMSYIQKILGPFIHEKHAGHHGHHL